MKSLDHDDEEIRIFWGYFSPQTSCFHPLSYLFSSWVEFQCTVNLKILKYHYVDIVGFKLESSNVSNWTIKAY